MKFFMDFEFTLPDDKQEILSVGIVVVDEEYQVCKTFYQLIKPLVPLPIGYKRISQDEWSNAVPFEVAYKRMKEFLGDNQADIIYCYGGKDAVQFESNCVKYNLPNFLINRIINIESLITSKLKLDMPLSIEGIILKLGREKVKPIHHALVDAYDLMLINEAIDKKEKIKENPFYTEAYFSMKIAAKEVMATQLFNVDEKNAVCKKKSLDLFPYKNHLCQVYSADESKYLDDNESNEGLDEWNNNAVFYQCIMKDIMNSNFVMSYKKDDEIILDGKFIAHLHHPVQLEIELITEEGQKLIDSGIVYYHLYSRIKMKGNLFFKHRLSDGTDYYFSLCNNFTEKDGLLKYPPLMLQGTGVLSVNKQEDAFYLYLSELNSGLTTVTCSNKYVIRLNDDISLIKERIEEVKDVMLHHLNTKYYALNVDILNEWLQMRGIEGISLKDFSKFLKNAKKQTGIREDDEFMCALKLGTFVGFNSIELEHSNLGLAILRYSREIISHPNVIDIFDEGAEYTVMGFHVS